MKKAKLTRDQYISMDNEVLYIFHLSAFEASFES